MRRKGTIATIVLAALAAGVGAPPAGAAVNDPACEPPAEHPYPVVLVHGTFLDRTEWDSVMAPALSAGGYCVFALDYGNRGLGDIEASAATLRDFVNATLATTGARKVAIVGHSQGGMMPRHYIRFLGGAKRVDEVVGLSPSNHGTTNPLAGPLGDAGVCPACRQQVAGSDFLTRLNDGDETPGKVRYTQIQTTYDEVVTPYDSAFLAPSKRVTNVLLQDRCPGHVVEHIGIATDPIALQWIENALDRPGPADHEFVPDC